MWGLRNKTANNEWKPHFQTHIFKFRLSNVQQKSFWIRRSLKCILRLPTQESNLGSSLIRIKKSVICVNIPFHATAARQRCCCQKDSQNLCRYISLIDQLHFYPKIAQLFQYHWLWKRWALSGQCSLHDPGDRKKESYRRHQKPKLTLSGDVDYKPVHIYLQLRYTELKQRNPLRYTINVYLKMSNIFNKQQAKNMAY